MADRVKGPPLRTVIQGRRHSGHLLRTGVTGEEGSMEVTQSRWLAGGLFLGEASREDPHTHCADPTGSLRAERP